MFQCWDGIGQVISGARFPPDVTIKIEAKQFSLGFIRPENLVSHSLRVLCKLQVGFNVSFTKERLPSSHSVKCWL